MKQKNNLLNVINNNTRKKKTTTGDNIVMKMDSPAAGAIHPETDDDADNGVKEARATPSTGAAQFFQHHPSTATSPNAFDIIAYAL